MGELRSNVSRRSTGLWTLAIVFSVLGVHSTWAQVDIESQVHVDDFGQDVYDVLVYGGQVPLTDSLSLVGTEVLLDEAIAQAVFVVDQDGHVVSNVITISQDLETGDLSSTADEETFSLVRDEVGEKLTVTFEFVSPNLRSVQSTSAQTTYSSKEMISPHGTKAILEMYTMSYEGVKKVSCVSLRVFHDPTCHPFDITGCGGESAMLPNGCWGFLQEGCCQGTRYFASCMTCPWGIDPWD